MTGPTRSYVPQHAVIGEERPYPDHASGSRYPMTMRTIRAGRHEIGLIVHRQYDSRYPAPFEVLRHGSPPWSFHDTLEQALRGADDYARAFLARGPHRRGDGVFDLSLLTSPIARVELAATPSLLRPWDTSPAGRARVAAELRDADRAAEVDLHKVLAAAAAYIAEI